MELTTATLKASDSNFQKQLINALPGYKCLQLVGTVGIDGHSNLGLFNSIFHIGASPALLGMVFRPQSANHDTLSNIQRTGCYTFNNVTIAIFEQAHQTSARYESGVSEFVECGLTEYFVSGIEAPFVAESTIKIGLNLKEIMPVAINGTTIVIGEVNYINTALDLVAQDGQVDHLKAGTVTVSGLDTYYSTSPLARLGYAKPGQVLKRI